MPSPCLHPPTPRGRSLRAALCLVALAGVAGCAHAGAQAGGGPPGAALRIATWNILYLNRDLARVVQDLEASDADVLALQEVTEEAWGVLEPALAGAWPHRSFDGEFALFSRHPLGWVQYVEPEFRRRGVQIAWLEVAPPVLVANVHLEPQVLDDSTPSGVVHSLDRAERTHLDELKHLLRRLDPAVPHIITGDFNSMPAYGARELLQDRGYVDVAAATSLWPDTTWADAIFGVPFWLRIDYVYVRGGIVPVACEARSSPASDHRLLVSDLTLPAPAKY